MTPAELAEIRARAEATRPGEHGVRRTRKSGTRSGLAAMDDRDALLAEVERLTVERDEWKRRRDLAVAQCRHLHQDGLPRAEWHERHCGAMQGLRKAEAERTEAQMRLGMVRELAESIRRESHCSHLANDIETLLDYPIELLVDGRNADEIAAGCGDVLRDHGDVGPCVLSGRHDTHDDGRGITWTRSRVEP
jgi:hypothetical protein